MVTVSRYARTVINQHEQQYTRNDWIKPENAQNYVTSTSAKGSYTKVNSKYIKPHVLYAYDFELNLPDEAVVTSLKFHVRMRCTDKLDVLRPRAIFNSYKKGVFKSDTAHYPDGKGETGDYAGVYSIYPKKKVSSSYDTVIYEMPAENLKKFEDLHYTFNQQGFGIQLVSRDATTTGTIYIEWIKVVVTYELPNRIITFENLSVDREAPSPFMIDEEKPIKITTINNSIAKEADRDINIVLPLGFELVSYKEGGKKSSFNPDTMVWRVNGAAKVKNTLTLNVIPRAKGFKEIRAFTTETRWWGAYVFVESDRVANYDEIYVTPHNIRRGEISCFDVALNSQSSSSTYVVTVRIPNFQANDFVNCTLDVDTSDEGIELVNAYPETGQLTCTFHVPVGKQYYLKFAICYLPRAAANATTTYVDISTTNMSEQRFIFDLAPAYEKHIVFNKDENGNCSQTLTLTKNRIISQVEGDLDILPIFTDEYDKDMYVAPSTFGLNQWSKVRYIGCVEVPYAHYDPDHSSKDKLLDEHYKNKEYVGKENAVDEDISLKIRIPRRKTPTLIGLVNIDRPIPINLVPSAFENDPLNHRGWAEFYGIKVKPTNPLYDDCELDVKYITHNIISRFNIKHEGLVNPNFKLPSVFTNSLESGADVGTFFDVETDGSYIYDGEDIVTHRNMFSFTNLQDILLRSKKPLAARTQFEFYWDNIFFDEARENNLQRVIRLVDDKDRVIFEYEYFNFDFSDDVYTCNVIGRALTNNGYNIVINEEIYLHSDVEYTDDEEDTEYDEDAIDVYGSSVAFELNNNQLTVTEKGFSGYEFKRPATLISGTYYLEVYWKNNNNDVDTANILNYFNFEINELSFDDKLAEYYSKLIVSPYPVPYKKIVFTRECDEGTLYYLAIEEENEDFSFLLEPFYQYKCGVDLVAEGSSIFDFNNSYPVIYIQNGLIRFGINRLNGDLYLDKWDFKSKEYIRTNRFRIEKFDDAEVSTINDDIIVVKVSDITITMWRGRPYVMLQHETEDITILNTFNQVFADGIADKTPSEYPVIWNLANSKNLLAECVGGTKLLKSSCITVTEEDTVLEDLGDFTITADKTECYVGEEIICTFDKAYADGVISLIRNEKVIGTNRGNEIHNVEPSPEPNTELAMQLHDEGLNTIYAVYHGTETTNMEVSNTIAINVIELEVTEDGGGNEWKIECIGGKSLKYNQGTVDFLVTCGGEPAQDIEVVVSNPHQTWHIDTGTDGKVFSKNVGVVAGTHDWIASVYDEGELLCSTTVKITIKEATPQIVGERVQMSLGEKAKFKIIDDSKGGISKVTMDLNIGGSKFVRTSNDKGEVYVKMSKQGEFTAKVKYAGEKGKYKSASKNFTIIAGGEDTA